MLKDELEAIIKSDNIWAGRSTLVLAIGILGEYVVLPFTEDVKAAWKKPLKILFAVMVVAGIAGEYEFSSRIARNADRLQQISDRELADAVTKAGDAQTTAKGLDLQIAKSNADAAAARRDSEKLRKDNLVLQSDVLNLREKMADRRITSEGQSRVAGTLCRFAHRNVQINLYDSDGEIQALAKDIEGSLPEKCGENIGFVVSTGMLKATIGFSGIRVILKVDSPQSDKDFAKAVVSALQAERLKIDGPMPPQPFGNLSGGGGAVKRVIGVNGDPVTIEIGKKP